MHVSSLTLLSLSLLSLPIGSPRLVPSYAATMKLSMNRVESAAKCVLQVRPYTAYTLRAARVHGVFATV